MSLSFEHCIAVSFSVSFRVIWTMCVYLCTRLCVLKMHTFSWCLIILMHGVPYVNQFYTIRSLCLLLVVKAFCIWRRVGCCTYCRERHRRVDLPHVYDVYFETWQRAANRWLRGAKRNDDHFRCVRCIHVCLVYVCVVHWESTRTRAMERFGERTSNCHW